MFIIDETKPYQFQLAITQVDAEIVDMLLRKLADGAEGEPLVSKGNDVGRITVAYAL